MKTGTALALITEVLRANPAQSIYMSGAPGVGKTSLAYALAEQLALPADRVLLFRPSLRDPVDLMGVPSTDGGVTTFCPPAELAAFRAGTGPGLIIWDELAQAGAMMQNAIGGALLDRVLGALRLDAQVMQIATGNRTTDKAGANRIVSQLANRVMLVDVDVGLDDWCGWAMREGLDPLVIAFIRLRPDLLSEFDPDRFSNPTPRSWEATARLPHGLKKEHLIYAASGLVGEAAAAEYVGFRGLADKMPSIDGILMAPATAEVPTDPGVMYAVGAALAHRATAKNVANVIQYAQRLPLEFATVTVKDVLVRQPALFSAPAVTAWIVKHGEALNV